MAKEPKQKEDSTAVKGAKPAGTQSAKAGKLPKKDKTRIPRKQKKAEQKQASKKRAG